MRAVAFLLAAATPLAALASFGGGDSWMCHTPSCHFKGVGLLLGIVGVPVSAVVFLLALGFLRHPQRSQGKCMLIGALAGIAAFELGALAGAYMAAGKVYAWSAFLWVYAGIAVAALAYARSRPPAR